MAILYRRSESKGTSTGFGQRWHHAIPLFVIAFVLMACIRSLGDSANGDKALGFIPMDQWRQVDANAKFFASWLLATALGAVGLGTALARFRGLGLKPFSVAFAAALSVGAVSVALIKLIASVTS